MNPFHLTLGGVSAGKPPNDPPGVGIRSEDVIIKSVGNGWVEYSDIVAISKHFNGAKVGEVWRVTLEYSGQFPTGKIIGAVRVSEAKLWHPVYGFKI